MLLVKTECIHYVTLCHSHALEDKLCMFCVIELMPRVMCKITSLICGDKMILVDTMVLYVVWCLTTKDMKYHILSHDVIVRNCNDASWGYTDASASA